ncbi:nitrate- and nitrite sensing domain-containing protein [Nonomuraea sp. K274]|uniref:histidine kinase n=1 Tax=Nonomuraea cypriaca TaxID=1187855 RepID=A0A931F5V2_9ACTN|nr:nitrate- and nitrite sensing domain-containing protein [Nonomuraea cypriaca]MBF8192471.1 nitrate- and nitrite sensing domain-containing protein [Nonomuraea cypriaca]
MRWRLTALILVPTIAAVVLGGARVVGSVQSIADYDRTAAAAEQAGRIRDLVQALGLERDTAGWIGASRTVRKRLAEPLSERKAAVDTLVKTVTADLSTIDDSYGPRVVKAAGRAQSDLTRLTRVRAEGQTNTLQYDFLTDSLLTLHDELSLMSDDPQTIGQFRALSALAGAKEEVSRQRVQLLQASYDTQNVDAKTVEQFIASNARQQSYVNTVGMEAGVDAGLKLSKALTGKAEYINVQLTKSRAITLASGRAPGVRITDNLISAKASREQWFNDNAVTIDVLHGIEKDLAAQVNLRSQELREAEIRNAIIAGALIVALLLLVLLLTVAIARSMVGPLRRLRTEALEIAGFRLPDVVRRLRVTGDTAASEVRPIEIEGNDEIGEVARAFDQVHRQAVRLAGEEADLRSNISSMFVNLSRRTQTLVERQISLIDGLEKGEQDGARLSDLFKLDHLATRMRRNSENLLVLAGHEATRRRSQPAKLVDVVRAALSEVEGYERVQVKVHRATSVLGSAANDLVHLVAELVENAIQFSPSSSQVTVTSSPIEGGGALLSVSDIGISMTEDEMGEANRRLAEPPVVDVSVSRRMGLFVVGRLALRHGIRVQLRRGEGAGLIAMVLLPPALIADGTQPPLPQRPAFGGGAAVPAQAPAQAQAGPPAQNGSSTQNGSFRSFPGFDTGDATRPPAPRHGPRSSFDGTPGTPRSPFESTPGTSPFESMPDAPRSSFDGTAGTPRSPFESTPDASRPGFGGAPGAARPGFGAFPSDAGPTGVAGFTADTDGGSYRRQPPRFDSGSHPSYPGTGSSLSGNGAFQTPPPVSYTTNDVRMPDPAPSVDVSPLEPEQEEFLPIFASVESAWFRRPPGEPAPQASGENQATPAQAVPSGEEAWRTAADAGWQAAAAAREPSLGGITAAGLPKRTPKANLVPGTANQPAQPQQRQTPAPPAPPVSADRLRSRMASYQQGVRRGRQEVRGQEDKSE